MGLALQTKLARTVLSTRSNEGARSYPITDTNRQRSASLDFVHMKAKMVLAKLHNFIYMRMPEKLNFLLTVLLRLKAAIYYRHIFGSFGRESILGKPVLLVNPHLMHVGNNVRIRQGIRLEAIACDRTYLPELRIGDNVNIEHFVQISTIGKLIIGSNVSIGSRTMILCGSHPFFDVNDPVKIGGRLGGKNSIIEIGDGAFIGAGCAVLQNVRIGKCAVIGAHSVVKSNVPDYSVVEGNPAVIVMRYDETNSNWVVVKR